jgi:phosphoadenosine phosphosulfate reductase
MIQKERTFTPGAENHIFWCRTCNLPLLSEMCNTCGGSGEVIELSPPADIRLCSEAGRDLLKDLFSKGYGYSDFLDMRIVLLNKIAGADRRDQVFINGRHVATLWFDVGKGVHKLDLESAGAALLTDRAKNNVVVCNPAALKGHFKGKWLDKSAILDQTGRPEEGDCVLLKIGKFAGVGVVRKRGDGSTAIRVRDVTREPFELSSKIPTIEDVIKANEPHLKRLEKTAVRELREVISQPRSKSKLPVNVSFSGGKDSLAALSLCLKAKPDAEVLFIDTKLEFPETVEYVKNLCSSKGLKLHVIEGEDKFFDLAESFGPPAKDYRWCCKTNKLGPLTAFVQKQYPKGCLTVEGRRIYESFSRSKIGSVESNPYVPGQTALCPIRNWRAVEVVLYTGWKGLPQNPLYEKDYERIGCWLCPASLQSEFENTRRTHPELHFRWTSYLRGWAKANELDSRYVDWGFWRWRRHPPKVVEIAKAQSIVLKPSPPKGKKIGLDVVRGRSPCGLKYSIEGTLAVPQNYPFSAVANALGMIGRVKYSEDMGVAVVEAKEGKVTLFANGHFMIVAEKEEAEVLLRKVVETALRVQMCTRCKICERRCRQRAIKVKDTIYIDEERCYRCGRCVKGCIAAAEAPKILGNKGRSSRPSAVKASVSA